MNGSAKHWLPSGLPPQFAVSSPQKPDRPAYLSALRSRLASLLRADPEAALAGLQMSQEAAPELWAIAEQVPQGQWPDALIRSDRLQSLLPDPWQVEPLKQPEPDNLRELLESLA